MSRCALDPIADEAILPLPGLEVDNLLAVLALLGLLRALDEAAPKLAARASWTGPPWRARLHCAEAVDEVSVSRLARRGIDRVVVDYDVDRRADVNFEGNEYRDYLARCLAASPISVELATALSAEEPRKKTGGPRPSPLVLIFCQGHQHFLDRVVAVPKGELNAKLKKAKSPPKLDDPKWIANALFRPWTRTDPTDGFRWDPEDDQRYALRASNPSDEGAASTVHGANQLATLGLLSFTVFPRTRHQQTRGIGWSKAGVDFVWPVWSEPLTRRTIEHLLDHQGILAGDIEKMRPLGVMEIYRARRIANGKFMNVARARVAEPPKARTQAHS